jgi:transcriptional regulator with XRE-family HTH domain
MREVDTVSLFPASSPDRPLKELLLEARLRNKFTIGTLAMKLGCEPDYYEALEEGTRIPAARWIPKLSRALTIPLDDLRDALDNAKASRTANRAR